MTRTGRRGSFWPNETQRALLEIALGPLEQAAVRWRALQPLDVAALETGSFGLLPLLYDRLSEVVPDDAQLSRLAGTYRSIWYRNGLLVDRLAVLLPLLRQRAHVQPLLVGGMSALLRWYPGLGLRPVPQIDLVVDGEAAGEAAKVATYAGWRPTWQTRHLTRLSDESSRVLVIHHGAPPVLAGALGEQGLSAFSERAFELESIEGTPRVLDPTDELLFICATGARTILPPSCQWLVDTRQVLSTEAAPPADLLLARAREFRALEPLRTTLLYLAGVVGTAVPDGYLQPLADQRGDWRERLAFSLAGARPGRFLGAAQLAAGYLQASATEPLSRALVRFPAQLQEAWQTTGVADTTLLGLRKSARLLRGPGR